jgi:hypothetical protein
MVSRQYAVGSSVSQAHASIEAVVLETELPTAY